MSASLIGIFRALWLLGVMATATTFLSARKLLERPGVGPFLTNALALVFLVPCVHSFCLGMEVTLTIPLGLSLLLAFRSQPSSWTLWRAIGIGLEVDVRRRYRRSLQHLPDAVANSDRVLLFDNSDDLGYRPVGLIGPSSYQWFHPLPAWATGLPTRLLRFGEQTRIAGT